MQDWLVGIVGSDNAPLASILLSAVIVVALVFVVIRLLRSVMRGGIGFRPSEGPRVEIVDVTAIDPKRKLVLVRRDQVEHLLLIGGGNDLVIEARIGRPAPPPARRVEQDFAPEATAPRAEPALAAPARPTRPQPAPAFVARPAEQPSPAVRFEGPSPEAASPRVEPPVAGAADRTRASGPSRVEPAFLTPPAVPSRSAERQDVAPASAMERRDDNRQTDRDTDENAGNAPDRAPASPAAREAPAAPPARAQPAPTVQSRSMQAPAGPRPQPPVAQSAAPRVEASRGTPATNPFAELGSAGSGGQAEPSRPRGVAPAVETGFTSRPPEAPRASLATPVVVAPRAPAGDSERAQTTDALRSSVAPVEADKAEARAPLMVRSFASSISERPRTPAPQPATPPAPIPVVAPAVSFAAPAPVREPSPAPSEDDSDLALMLSRELSFEEEETRAPPRLEDARRNDASDEAPEVFARREAAPASSELSIEEEMERLMRDFSAHTSDRR